MAGRKVQQIWDALAFSPASHLNSAVADVAGDLAGPAWDAIRDILKISDKAAHRGGIAYDFLFGEPRDGRMATRSEDEILGIEPDSPEARRAEVLRDAIEHSRPERTRRESRDDFHTPSDRDTRTIA